MTLSEGQDHGTGNHELPDEFSTFFIDRIMKIRSELDSTPGCPVYVAFRSTSLSEFTPPPPSPSLKTKSRGSFADLLESPAVWIPSRRVFCTSVLTV